MSDQLGPVEKPQRRRREFPVVAGVIALVAMIAIIGGVVGGAALVATRAAGLDGNQDLDGGSSQSATLYLPRFTDLRTEPRDEPTTLTPPSDEATSPAEPDQTATKPPKPEPKISLRADQKSVSAMGRIDLNGSYNSSPGAVLRVQQFEDGKWTDFPVTVSVGIDGFFVTYIQTGQLGPNRFRVLDTDTGEASNDVKVQIG